MRKINRHKHPINIQRIFVFPLILLALIIFLSGTLVFQLAITSFKTDQEQNAIYNVEQVSNEITHHREYAELLIESLQSNLISIGNLVMEQRSILSNDYLAMVSENTIAKYIYWYNPQGEILYDSRDEYVGWQVSINDPIHRFMVSGLDLFAEEIRKSETDDFYYQFVYIRDTDGYFIQLGVSAEYIVEITQEYGYQNLFAGILQNHEEILYGLVLDTSLTAIYDTDLEDQGVSYADDPVYLQVLQGESIADDWYYPQINQFVSEVAVPIYHEGEIVGIIALGYSLARYDQLKNYFFIIFIIFTIIVITGYIVLQFSQIILPLIRLNTSIESIDVNSEENIVRKTPKGTLVGVHDALELLAQKISDGNKNTKVLTREIRDLAYTDFLTKIPNRLGFIETINSILKKDYPFAVVFIDLDGFKAYNDTKGHTFGDKLLITFANQLKELVSEHTYLARFGGDEFVSIYTYDTEQELEQFLKQILVIIENPVKIDNGSYYLDASIGVSVSPLDGNDADDLIRKADIAMYVSKDQGKNKITFFNESMHQLLSEEVEVVEKLKDAIKHEGFVVLYQPQVHIDTNEIVSLEALLRLKEYPISPSVFIPIAEKVGLINSIGQIVLEQVVKQLSDWKSHGISIVPVYVNFSSNQMEDSGIIDFIKKLLEKYDISSQYLGIELTESSLIKNEAMAIQTIHDIRALGLKLALDDFGSGQAGLNYLMKYQVDTVKLDKSFSDKYLNKEGLRIFNTIVGLSRLLKLEILAEGIETENQINLLKTTLCKLVQGFYYYRPSDSSVIRDLLESQRNKETD